MATEFMGLTLPTVSVTPGSTFATQINAAIETIDLHDHSPGYGTPVITAGMLIDANLTFNGYAATSLKASTYSQQSALATANSVWVNTSGNLYFTNGSGTSVQITSSGTLNTSALITAVYAQLSLAGNLTIGPTDTYTHYKVSTAAARAITLPAANAVQPGRYYIISDVTGDAATNNITINRAGSDTIEGATSYVISAAYGTVQIVSDGTSAWSVVAGKNATTTKPGVVRLAGDLAGTSSSPTVVSLTGSGGSLTMASGLNTVQFNAAASSPTIKVAAAAAPTVLYIEGQSASTGNTNGGAVTLAGGNDSGTGNGGSAFVAATLNGSYEIGVAVQAYHGSYRVTALQGNPSAASDFGSGDKVVYIANAVTTPSGTPSGGGVLFVQSGALKYIGTSGTVTTLAVA